MVELKADEQKLKAEMDPDVALILKSKNILVWEEMLAVTGYEDMGVVQELKEGTDLVGCTPKTGLWPSKFQPATITVAELHDVACKERDGLHEQFSGFAKAGLQGEVWRKTMEEVESGVLEGPIPLERIDVECPLSRRFGIQQGSKVRCIDDFSRSSINSCVQTTESPKPHTIDVFASLCAHLMGGGNNQGPWAGRTFDLVGAYRQCAIKPSSRKYAHIMVQKPDSLDLVGFRMRALPFGSVRSVHAFLRVSHSLWHILVKEMRVLMTNYFDDFISLSPASEAGAVTSCVHMCFKLLGWAFAETGDKAPDFSSVFHALGVSVAVKELHTGLVQIGNTDSRRQELVSSIQGILDSGRLTTQDALRLRGRLQFSAGNLFGSIAKSSLAAVSNHAYSSNSSAVGEDLRLALTLHKHLLLEGAPRMIRTASSVPWFIQTDACYEMQSGDVVAGIGAVLFDQNGKAVRFFSHKISDAVVEFLNPGLARKTTIFECEFFAAFCAFWLWGPLVNSAIVLYTDNGVRDTLISCMSRHALARMMLIAVLALEAELQLIPWYARVPTDSNLSDSPSRFSVEKLVSMGAVRTNINCEQVWAEVIAISRRWGEEQASTQPTG